jgi:TATA-box binding protein (TBP) (component of TFIID and TFIIIB)
MGPLAVSNTTAVIQLSRGFSRTDLLLVEGAIEPRVHINPDGSLSNRRFSYIRFKLNGASALVNTSGRVVIVGAKSLEALEGVCQQICAMLEATINGDVAIVNFVGTGQLNTNVRLEQLFQRANGRLAGGQMWLEPELFQGLVLAIDQQRVTLFRTGKYIITGCRNLKEVASLRRLFRRFLRDFQ